MFSSVILESSQLTQAKEWKTLLSNDNKVVSPKGIFIWKESSNTLQILVKRDLDGRILKENQYRIQSREESGMEKMAWLSTENRYNLVGKEHQEKEILK